jgi:hypothetical protein
MVKRAFKNHRLAIILAIINSVIVFEEFAHQHWYPPEPRQPGGAIPAGLGWYWTAVISLPCSVFLYEADWPWRSESRSLIALLTVGAIQWGVIGAIMDRNSHARRSAPNT